MIKLCCTKAYTDKVTKYSNVNLHGRCEGGKVGDLSTKDEVTELGEGKEDDEEHNGESCQIFGARSERR